MKGSFNIRSEGTYSIQTSTKQVKRLITEVAGSGELVIQLPYRKSFATYQSKQRLQGTYKSTFQNDYQTLSPGFFLCSFIITETMPQTTEVFCMFQQLPYQDYVVKLHSEAGFRSKSEHTKQRKQTASLSCRGAYFQIQEGAIFKTPLSVTAILWSGTVHPSKC